MKHIHVFLLTLVLVVVSAWIVCTRPTKQGLDLAGGVRVVLQAQTDKLQGKKWNPSEHLPGIVRIIRNRVDIQGVSEPLIQPKGEDQVVVELPDIRNKEEAIAQLKSTARMEFRHLKSVKDKRHRDAKYEMSVAADEEGQDVVTFTDRDGKSVKPEQVIAESPLILTGNDLKPNSRSQKDPQGYRTVVELEFNPEGKRKFAEFTRRNVDEILAIILDGRILSAPSIDEPILDGRAIIRGNFTVEEATRLAEFLNAGALPVPLDVVQTQMVEATLGRDSVSRSVQAGVWGICAVVAFMLGYYLLPGLIADIALGVYALLTFAVFKAIPVTLTLPGIAAYILSIGMAVDANILIFERLKEELRAGKTLRAAIDAGFARAFTSIFDSNMCTIITCLILGYYGTGPIRGFALVLGLGVIISFFTAIVVTRTILHLLVNTGFAHNPMLFGVGRQWVVGERGRVLDVVGRMKVYFAISALIILPGLYFWLGAHGLKGGIDFTGGSIMQLEFRQPVARASIVDVLDGAGLHGSMVQKSREGEKVFYVVRTKELSNEKLHDVQNALAARLGEFKTPKVENVGATISKELTVNAIKAVILASLGIVLYLSIRFAIGGLAYGLRFGVCAVIALLHDVGVVVGFFAIFGHFFRWEVDSLFVTALLTIIGFSVHDTIVIFDRIRENLRHRVKGDSFDGLVNKSIMQSFARSINTSLTVVLTLAALLAFGAPVIRQFVVALLIGVVSGTYSSIFNASQLLVLWDRLTEKQPAGRAAVEAARAARVRELKPIAEDSGPDGGEGAEEMAPRVSEPKAGTAKVRPKKRKRRF